MKSNTLNYNKGDLFKLTRYFSQFNACIGTNGGPYNCYDYSVGYFFAARTVAENVIKTQRNLDISVYPLFFLFRHAIELSLKHMWKVTGYLLNEDRKSLSGHNLEVLWKSVRVSMKKIDKFEKDGEVIDFLEEVIGDVCEIDMSAEVFRFPESLNNEKFLQDRTHMNIYVLHELIVEVEKVFDYLFRYKTELWERNLFE